MATLKQLEADKLRLEAQTLLHKADQLDGGVPPESVGWRDYVSASVNGAGGRARFGQTFPLGLKLIDGTNVRVFLDDRSAEFLFDALLEHLVPHRFAQRLAWSLEEGQRYRASQSSSRSDSPSSDGSPQDGQSV